LLDGTETEIEIARELSILESVLTYLIYIGIFLGMTYGRFLELSSLQGVDEIIVASFQDLYQSYHLLILEQIEGSSSKEERVSVYHLLDFSLHLLDHGLVYVAIRSLIVSVSLNGSNCRPTSLGLRIAYDEVSETHERHSGRVKGGREDQDHDKERQQQGEL